MTDKTPPSPEITPSTGENRRPLPPAAERALAEAEARRAAAEQAAKENIHKVAQDSPKEIQGPSGPEPTRYGDWENKGIASDF